MSFEPGSKEHEVSAETDNEIIIKLLKAILIGIAMIADSTEESLIDHVEDI